MRARKSPTSQSKKNDLLSTQPQHFKSITSFLDVKSLAAFASVKKTYAKNIDYKPNYELYFSHPFETHNDKKPDNEPTEDAKEIKSNSDEEQDSTTVTKIPSAQYKKKLKEAVLGKNKNWDNIKYARLIHLMRGHSEKDCLKEIKQIFPKYDPYWLYTTHSYATDSYEFNYLFWANKKGWKKVCDYVYETAKKLYEGGWFFSNGQIDVKKEHYNHSTLLHWAIVCYQNIDILKSLVEQGADIEAKASGFFDFSHMQSNNPLGLAARVGNKPAFEYLYNLYIKEIKVIDPNDLLRLAAFGGHLNIIQYLCEELEKPIDNLMLGNAIRGKHLPIVKYLLSKGAHVTHINFTSIIERYYNDGKNLETLAYIFDHCKDAKLPNNLFSLDVDVHQKTLEYLLERAFSEYKQAKENLQAEIDILPPRSILKIAMQACLDEISNIKKKSEDDISLLIGSLDKTTQLLANLNKGTFTQATFNEALNEYIAFGIEKGKDLPSYYSMPVLAIIGTVFMVAGPFFLEAPSPLAYAVTTTMITCGWTLMIVGFLMIGIGVYIAISTDLKFRKEDKQRYGNQQLYRGLSETIDKSAKALKNQSVFKFQMASEQKASHPAESKRSTTTSCLREKSLIRSVGLL